MPRMNYLDASQPVEDRVRDLIGRMSLREKVGQLTQYTAEPEEDGQTTTGLDDLNVELKNAREEEYAKGVRKKAQKVIEGEVGSFLKVPGIEATNYLQKVAAQSRLKIPLLIGTDAIHGHGMYTSPVTLFPTEIGMASTFSTELAREFADLTRAEMRATGYHWTFSPNVEIVRDQRWGRTGETFGEDTHLSAEMGKAMVRGYQGEALSDQSVLACVKHLVGGGESFNGINAGEADLSQRSLLGVHYPPFQACVEEGCFTLMAAHNALNGVPCHAHRELLTELLREEWGFKGFVVSDWIDVYRVHSLFQLVDSREEACALSLNAGVDMNMHGPDFHDAICHQVELGHVSMERVEAALRPILEAKFRLGLFENAMVNEEEAEKIVLSQRHRDAALKMAEQSIVLLKNDERALPIGEGVSSVCVTGPSAHEHFILGDWSRPQPDENISTVLRGIEKVAPEGIAITHLPTGPRYQDSDMSCNPFEIDAERISQIAAEAFHHDLAIVVVGENALRHSPHMTCGENVDRSSLSLPGDQEALIEAIHNNGTKVIVVLINGRGLSIPWCAENVPAIVEAWEPGIQGGEAIAKVLFGEVNPSGRLPISMPRSSGHLKCFYNHTPLRLARYGDSSIAPLFPFGHGLSYTTFEYSNLRIKTEHQIGSDVSVLVDVKNTGDRAGDEVVLLYVKDILSSVVTPVRELKAFERVSLKPQDQKTLELILKPEAFSLINANLERVIEPGEFEIQIGELKEKILLY